MAEPCDTEWAHDVTVATTPQVDATLQLSARTVAWLADRPHIRKVVDSVWSTLADLERAGHHPGAIAALRFVLIHHQPPTPTGRCCTCRRFTWHRLWRRRPFPCTVWMNIHFELVGPLPGTGRHHKPDTTQPSATSDPSFDALPQTHLAYAQEAAMTTSTTRTMALEWLPGVFQAGAYQKVVDP